MKFFLATILTALICFIAGLYLPWWSIAIVAFLIALLIPQRLFNHFLSGFLGVFLLWFILAMWIDVKNESILSHRIAQLFHLGTASILLIIITAFVGGLVGGFAAMSGGSLRSRRTVKY
jgi:hypothetical protein